MISLPNQRKRNPPDWEGFLFGDKDYEISTTERFQPLSSDARLQDVITAINAARASLAAILTGSGIRHSDILGWDTTTGEPILKPLYQQ
jgi:hypothetical protein